MYAMAWHTNLMQRLGDLEVLILLVSCICHDLDHPGYNNIYQINARTELALRWALYFFGGVIFLFIQCHFHCADTMTYHRWKIIIAQLHFVCSRIPNAIYSKTSVLNRSERFARESYAAFWPLTWPDTMKSYHNFKRSYLNSTTPINHT